ncbi:photosystem II protein, Psb35-related [Calothrix sp. CCY 0018]|uniref:photosystem II protein, Psb35-related n=1 Tax=Calothrix sp. CCY 0018 TaxID=3103864 RepID=UPI0039C72C7A
MMTILISLFVVAWVAAALIGSQAYFRGEQRKPIHERNWASESFDFLAKSITGEETDYMERVPAYVVVETYASKRIGK